jgi:hypothetical protein
MERRARRELEKIKNPDGKLRETAEELKRQLEQEELSNDNDKIVKSNN